ncbi:hypothetical protein PInf_021442 [Phytophthora infestans]|nr:hypothetical protein PInf_021442 [Phytophthora infestans]
MNLEICGECASSYRHTLQDRELRQLRGSVYAFAAWSVFFNAPTWVLQDEDARYGAYGRMLRSWWMACKVTFAEYLPNVLVDTKDSAKRYWNASWEASRATLLRCYGVGEFVCWVALLCLSLLLFWSSSYKDLFGVAIGLMLLVTYDYCYEWTRWDLLSLRRSDRVWFRQALANTQLNASKRRRAEALCLKRLRYKDGIEGLRDFQAAEEEAPTTEAFLGNSYGTEQSTERPIDLSGVVPGAGGPAFVTRDLGEGQRAATAGGWFPLTPQAPTHFAQETGEVVLVQYAKSCFEFVPTSASEPHEKGKPGKDFNVVVTGNPGIGKSRFFLYCIFQLILREREDVKRLPPYELVVNHKKKYLKYDAASTEFVELNKTDVRALEGKPYVIRLVEATSSELTGWRGVSILFASPGVDGIDNFSKVDGLTFIMPTWTLEELEDYNSLLPAELKLAEGELLSRYDGFGGIPRFVFSQAMGRTEAKIKSAIASFSALDVISYCRKNDAVREKDYSHCVLEMVPTQADFLANFYLDFVSMHIAEAVIDKVHGDSLARVSEFAVVHDVDDSGSTAVIRGKVYELLCHKWFRVHMQRTLHFRSLCSATLDAVTIPKEMETVRFAALDKLKLAKSWTYYRPTSKSFGALDAFIWDGHSKCYGLQMTLNAAHGIKAAPLNKLLKWLQKADVDTDHFYFTFVVPSKIATSYRKQLTTTATGAASKAPGASANVGQFVAALNVDGGDN